MDEKDQKNDLIEIECPVCKDKSMRHPTILKICAFGCKECGFIGMHVSMKAEQERKKKAN